MVPHHGQPAPSITVNTIQAIQEGIPNWWKASVCRHVRGIVGVCSEKVHPYVPQTVLW